MKKNIKWIVIFALISIVLECGIFAYNKVINKLYAKYHFIGNEAIIFKNDDLKVKSITNEYDSLKINVSSDLKIYNIVLELNHSTDNSIYIRVRSDYGDKLLPSANSPTTEFKTYYKDGINTSNLEIVFPKGVINKNEINSVIINSNLQFLNQYSFSFLRVLLYFTILVITYFIIKNRKWIINKINNMKLENFFTFLIALFGIIYVFVNVPLDIYDEHGHVLRAYELSMGNVKTDQHEFPKAIVDFFKTEDGNYPNRNISYKDLFNKISDSLNSDVTTKFSVGSTGGYSLINYFAVTCGVFLARIFHLNALFTFYLGRLFNLALYTIVIYFALKICPSNKIKKILGVICILPMSINLAASFSPDTVINAFTILSISFALKLKFDEKVQKISLIQFLILVVFITVPIVCKVAYIFLLGLILILPSDKFKNRKSKLIYGGLSLIIVAISYFIFNILLKGNVESSIEPNTIEQLIYCLAKPYEIFKIIFNSLDMFSINYLTELNGGWNTPGILSIILTFVLLLIIFEEDNSKMKIELLKHEKIIILFIACIEILATFVGLYICWSTAHLSYVKGIQGRYFLPILPVLAIGISKEIFSLNIKNKRIKFFILISITYIITIIHSVINFL